MIDLKEAGKLVLMFLSLTKIIFGVSGRIEVSGRNRFCPYSAINIDFTCRGGFHIRP